MSERNVKIVRGCYADALGLIGAFGKVALKAEFDFTQMYPEQPLVRGIDDLMRFRDTNPWRGAPIHFAPERFFDVDDDRVLVFVHVSATGHGSGAPVEIDVAHEFTMLDELIVGFKVYASRNDALEAVGLSEEDAQADS